MPEHEGMEEETRERFLGLTKTGFFAVLIAWIIISTTAFAFFSIRRDSQLSTIAHRNSQQVQFGKEARVALCALRDNTFRNMAEERASLRRSKKAFQENPHLLPNVPQSLIQQGFKDKQRTIDRLQSTVDVLNSTLTCPEKEGKKNDH